MTRIVVRAAVVAGVLAVVAAGAVLIVLGLSGYFDVSICDPTGVDCDTVIDNPAGGESAGSGDSQRFERGLSAVLFVIAMLFVVPSGIRLITRGRRRRTPPPRVDPRS